LPQKVIFASAPSIRFLFMIIEAAPADPKRQTQFNHAVSGILIVLHRGNHFEEFHGLGGHEARSGEERQLEVSGTRPSRELVKARVEALSSYRWSSYPAYVGRVRKPEWLTTESIYRFFGDHTLHSLRGAYRRQLEEMAALGQLETDWRA
jgi:hypothetical protein